MKTIIFDLDGTLADLTHRLHHVKNGNNRWGEFFSECVNDTPIIAVCELVKILYSGPYDEYVEKIPKIIIISGRSDIVRTETEQWLCAHGIQYDELIMRPAGDYTPDHILKEHILDQLLREGHEILFTVDDRQRVVDMWRKRGITCLQAAAWEEDAEVKVPGKQKGLLTLMVGPSGAGKSMWLWRTEAAALEFNIHSSHIISSDQIRHDICGNFKDQTRNGEVFAALHAIVKTRIDHGLPTIIDATNIKRADRVKAIELSAGGPVRYIIIDRPMEEKRRDGGWRNELGFDLLMKHQNTFNSNLKDILKGDGYQNVEVIDLRKI